MVKYTDFGESSRDSEGIKPLGVHRNMVMTVFVYCFVDPDVRVEIIFRKARTAESGVLILK